MHGKETRIGNDSRSLPALGRVLCLHSPESVITRCATWHFNYRSTVMEELGLQALHRRVAGIDVHRMLHVVTVLIEQKARPDPSLAVLIEQKARPDPSLADPSLAHS